jgi:hypothetical protein
MPINANMKEMITIITVVTYSTISVELCQMPFFLSPKSLANIYCCDNSKLFAIAILAGFILRKG